jgi:uncharacterized membrane protein
LATVLRLRLSTADTAEVEDAFEVLVTGEITVEGIGSSACVLALAIAVNNMIQYDRKIHLKCTKLN